jgi:hypothetical protein
VSYAVSKLDEDERDCVGVADAMGRIRETLIVSEPGLTKVLAVGHPALSNMGGAPKAGATPGHVVENARL